MSDNMINIKILRKCGGELEHSIKCRCVEPCSTKDYINAAEDMITKPIIGKTWTKIPRESKMVPKISREDRRPEIPVLKCHKCGSASNLAKTCTKKTKINEVQGIEEAQCTEEKEESDLDSAVSEDTLVEDYPIEKITAFFEVTEVHTHLPQHSEDFNNLINIQDARMCKIKPARGKGYTPGASCIKSILMNDIKAKVNFDTGAFCTCVGKDYLQAILPGWKNHLSPIEGVQFSSASNNMYPLVILETNLVFPHPAGSIIMKTGILIMDNSKSQHIILGSDYLNIYGIDINNHKDRYFTIGENKRQKFSFPNIPKPQLVQAQINPSLRWALINTPDNAAYVPLEAEPQIPIEGINKTDIGTEFFEEVRESYKKDRNFHILTSLLDEDFKDTSLVNALDEVIKNSYSEGRFHLFDGIVYHRAKKLVIYSGHLSEDRTLEKVKNCAWWPSWQKETIEYFHTCDECQKANRSTGKKFGLMIHIQEPKSPWEVVHMDWVTELPPGSD
ncbi:hypothetical protein O181_063155 [Austropuccinia psidii MF-1]|uniref:Integrase zinc-binding domain-containing protein n=1 Tax=Austropuccinia psidii MF-1 TaxID=1389203 RepID=A0A9Q3EIB3_9BASI|nr:hypothetical protein [Austropuccinia psidii MF-1]